MLQKLIYSIFVVMSSKKLIFTFLFLELFLDEHAMVLRYVQEPSRGGRSNTNRETMAFC